MNKQNNRDKVADALESGKYEQGKHGLNLDGKFCCLGVACEVYQREVGGLVIERDETGDKCYDGKLGILPFKVQKWLGFAMPNGKFGKTSLVFRNDKARDTFKDIAQYFRNPPEGLLAASQQEE